MDTSSHGPGLTSLNGSRVVILERPGCHLCEDASRIVHSIADPLGESVDHVDITLSDELAKRWSIEIPVVSIDGAVHSVYRVDAKAFKTALTKKGSLRGALRRVIGR